MNGLLGLCPIICGGLHGGLRPRLKDAKIGDCKALQPKREVHWPAPRLSWWQDEAIQAREWFQSMGFHPLTVCGRICEEFGSILSEEREEAQR